MGGGCDRRRRSCRKEDINGSVTRVKCVEKSPFSSMETNPWYGSNVRRSYRIMSCAKLS
jgi:hypothetical protein